MIHLVYIAHRLQVFSLSFVHDVTTALVSARIYCSAWLVYSLGGTGYSIFSPSKDGSIFRMGGGRGGVHGIPLLDLVEWHSLGKLHSGNGGTGCIMMVHW